MRVLLTGATGLIGSELVAAAPADWEVVALGRRPGPAVSEWLEADLTDPAFVRRLPTRIDAVIHLAQASNYRDFPRSGPDLVAINVAATSALLQHALAAGAERFVFASTATVYRTSHTPLAEDAPLHARSAYATSKLAAELLVQPYRSLLDCRVLRIFTSYGALSNDRLIPDLVSRVRTGRPVQVAGRNGLLVSPLHAADAAIGVAAAVTSPVSDSEVDIVNLGGESIGIRAMAQAIGRVVGREPLFDYLPGPDPGGYPCDRRKAQRVLGLTTPASFEEGIERALAPTGA